MLKNKVASAEEIEAVNRRVNGLLEEDLAWTESQPSPEPEAALGGVYADDHKPSAIGAGS